MTLTKIQECTLVPSRYFDEKDPGCFLFDVSTLNRDVEVNFVRYPEHDAVLVYSGSRLPELGSVLGKLASVDDYSKIVASYKGGCLSLAVSDGNKLLFANTFQAQDFTTAEYYLFGTLKSLQINPEFSTIRFCSRLSEEQKISLFRYFKSVEQI